MSVLVRMVKRLEVAGRRLIDLFIFTRPGPHAPRGAYAVQGDIVGPGSVVLSKPVGRAYDIGGLPSITPASISV